MTILEAIAYLGEPAEAAAFALAGIEARAPAPGDEAAALERARARSQVVLLGAAYAARLPRALLEHALAGAAPLVMVVPEPGSEPGLPDPVERARRQLGMEA